MKKYLFALVAMFALSSIPASAQSSTWSAGSGCADIRFISKEPTKEMISKVPGTKYIYSIYKVKGGPSIGKVYVSLYDDGSVEVENDTNRSIKAGASATRADKSRIEVTPVVLEPEGGSVHQPFRGGKFVKTTLKIIKVW